MIRLVCILIGYVFGLFQSSYIYGKLHGIDIKKHGSGNAGTTNTLRVLGKKAGAIVLICDMVKCGLAMMLVRFLFKESYSDILPLLALYAAAGTILGAKLYMPETHVMCSMVDSDPFDVIVPQLMKESVELLETEMEIPVPDLVDMCGPGYSIPSEEGNEAIAMMMELGGIVLDTCYTGKAFAGLIKRARAGEYKPEDNVLFVHSGGAGGLFAQDWENL